MAKNPKCEIKTNGDCDTTYPDLFKATHIRGNKAREVTECLTHAAISETKGRPVRLIDMR